MAADPGSRSGQWRSATALPDRLLRRLRRRLRQALPANALGELLASTAREAWPLLTALLISSVVLALCEGATFSVIFQAAKLLTEIGRAHV